MFAFFSISQSLGGFYFSLSKFFITITFFFMLRFWFYRIVGSVRWISIERQVIWSLLVMMTPFVYMMFPARRTFPVLLVEYDSVLVFHC